MPKARSKNPMKAANWAQYKASQLRSSWRTRAMKYGENLDEVPTRVQIQEWLEAQSPIQCYLTGGFISTEIVEVDHRVPICRNGKFDLSNAACTSRYYNNTKGSMTEEEFRGLLKLVKTWEDKGASLFKRLMASNHIYSRFRKK